MTTLEEVFEQFKQLPDWELYPLPEVFYEKFNIKKPQPTDFRETLSYNPPAYQSLNPNGKIEERGPLPGGVREIKDFQQLHVEVKKTNEESGELEDYPTPDPEKVKSALNRILPLTDDDIKKYMIDYDKFFQNITRLIGRPANDDGKEIVDIEAHWKSKGLDFNGKP